MKWFSDDRAMLAFYLLMFAASVTMSVVTLGDAARVMWSIGAGMWGFNVGLRVAKMRDMASIPVARVVERSGQ